MKRLGEIMNGEKSPSGTCKDLEIIVEKGCNLSHKLFFSEGTHQDRSMFLISTGLPF